MDAGQTISFFVFVAGVQATFSERRTNINRTVVNLLRVVTGVTAGQAIDIRWSVTAGLVTSGNKTMVLTRVN